VAMQDGEYFKSINTGRLWYKDDPYILATKATHCFTCQTQSLVLIGELCTNLSVGACVVSQNMTWSMESMSS
jgi:hypothetical protein